MCEISAILCPFFSYIANWDGPSALGGKRLEEKTFVTFIRQWLAHFFHSIALAVYDGKDIVLAIPGLHHDDE